MAVLTSAETKLGIKIRKKLTGSSAYGVRKYGGFHYGGGANIQGIYRVRHRWGKVIQEKMSIYFPTNPQTGPQQTNRAKMTSAVAAWQALTDEQKEIYNERAVGRNMSGYNIFLSEYLLSH